MTAERDVTRLLRGWLQEDMHEDAGRVLESTLQIVDVTPQRRAWKIFGRATSARALVLTAAAALAAVAILSATLLPRLNVGSNATSRPAPSANVLYRSAPNRLPGGTYFAKFFAAPFTMDVPDDWTGLEHGTNFVLIVKTANGGVFGSVPNTVGLSFDVVDNVYADPCRDKVPLASPPRGVDGLVNALRSWPEVRYSPVTDVFVGGYPGKTFDLDFPPSMSSCPNDRLHTWTYNDGTPNNNTGAAASHLRMWVVDVQGTTVLIAAGSSPDGKPETDVAELYAIVQSVSFK
jgi:hypothetical protein